MQATQKPMDGSTTVHLNGRITFGAVNMLKVRTKMTMSEHKANFFHLLFVNYMSKKCSY